MLLPSDVLRRHVELSEAMQDYGLQSLVRYMIEEVAAATDVSDQFVRVIASHALHSHTYLIKACMNSALINTANTYLTGAETSESDPPPQGCGVAFFEDPLILRELRGRNQLVHALSWGPAMLKDRESAKSTSLTVIVLWSDVRRDVDDVLAESPNAVETCRRLAAGFSPVVYALLASDQRVGPEVVRASEAKVTRAIARGADPARICAEGPNVLRWTIALWRLLSGTVGAERESVRHFDRAVRRRAERASLAPAVEVVTLRRTASPVLNPGSGTPLQWRSPVAGHTQACVDIHGSP